MYAGQQDGCFRKGCSQNVNRTRVREASPTRVPQKNTLPTGHKNMREDPRCSSGLQGAQPAGNLERNTCPELTENLLQKPEEGTDVHWTPETTTKPSVDGKKWQEATWTRTGQRDRRSKKETGPMREQDKQSRGYQRQRGRHTGRKQTCRFRIE